jgi:uncharacterized protein (TIGR02687 family)
MNDRIKKALIKLFEKNRIVFWYDGKKELRQDFDALELEGIEKIELANNEFGVKHRLLREEPEQRFLLYHEGPQPRDMENWLLDVLLAHGEFSTDQVAIWLSELELGPEFSKTIQAHAEFMNAGKRKDALKRLLKPDDTMGGLQMKMLAVCAGADPRMDTILEKLLAELAQKRDEKIKLITRCGLEPFLWEQMKRCYGYISETPSLKDFSIELFRSCYAMGTDGDIALAGDALVFLKRWKDSRQFEASFESISHECAKILNMEHELMERDSRDLVDLDYFRLIDQKIISDLVQAVSSRTISEGDCALVVRKRRQSHWYGDFKHLYDAVEAASSFISVLDGVNLCMDSLANGIKRYTTVWFRLDQLYRRFLYNLRKSGQTSLLGILTEQMENLYSNTYLLKVNDTWQEFVDNLDRWDVPGVTMQHHFFKHRVSPFLKAGKKVFVIVSDALRYEIGEELLGLIRREDRYEASLEPAVSTLPSYTQLGMAALLPNKELSLAENGTVLVDGQSSQGLANRMKLLAQGGNFQSTALKSDEFLNMNKEACRALTREHDVVYIFHNRIDATGDKRESEERVFEAVEDTLEELLKLIKKLAGANASNMLITADHGFIYQNRTIDESDYADVKTKGENLLFRDRRFVMGKGLEESSSLRKFSSSDLGLAGDMEVQIPKSINRLRLKGSGSRFVHGGASIQEVVIPVIQINKKRRSDTSKVEVDILRGSSQTITSGQLAVAFYQKDPVSEKRHPRHLRARIVTQEGEVISDSHDLLFDLCSENSRERELPVQFVLTRKADKANGQEVLLKLEEKEPGTSFYGEYKTLRYLLRRSFTSDFDF